MVVGLRVWATEFNTKDLVEPCVGVLSVEVVHALRSKMSGSSG